MILAFKPNIKKLRKSFDKNIYFRTLKKMDIKISAI